MSEELIVPEFTEGYRDQVAYDPEHLAAISPDEGLHNKNLRELFDRSIRMDTYRDRSTIMIVPAITNPLCRDQDGHDVIPVPPRVAGSWLKLQVPTNQKWNRILVENAEVGDAYNQAIRIILDDEGLSTWKYVLTCEIDNVLPPDGLLQLIEDIETACECGHIMAIHSELNELRCNRCNCSKYVHVEYDVIGGIYHAKGFGGFPMSFGKVTSLPRDFQPWNPPPDAVSEVCGLGMGFTLFKIETFRTIPPPWFRTIQSWVPGIGERLQTQDLYYFNKAAQYGYRFAISTNARVGHIDNAGIIWNLITPIIMTAGIIAELTQWAHSIFNFIA